MHRNTILLNGLHYLPAGGYQLATQVYLPDQRRQGHPTYGDLKGELALPFESWHGGFGQAVYRDRPKYFHGYAVDGSIRGVLMPALSAVVTTTPASTGPFVKFVQYNQTIYAAGGRYVLSWNTGTSQWDSARDLGSGVSATDAEVYFALDSAKYARVLYIGTGTGAAYQEFNGSAWSTASVRAHRLAVLRNVLWRATTDPTTGAWSIYSSGDGTNWTGPTMVGQGDVTVNALLAYDDRLVAITESQILAIEPDGFARDVFPGLRFLRYVNNGLRAGIDAGRNTLLVPVREGMMEWAGDFITNVQTERSWQSVGPDTFAENDSVVRGRFTCVAAGGPDVVYAGMTAVADSGSNHYYVMKRRLYPDGAPGDGWHPIARFSVPVTAVFVERVTAANGNPTLWIAVGNDSTDADIYRMLLPRDNDNPVGDSTIAFASASQATGAAIDGGMRTVEKVWLAFEMHATVATDGHSIKLSYALEDSTFAVLGTMTGTGIQTFVFPSAAVSRIMTPRIDFVASGATAPRIHRLILKYQMRFPRRRVWLWPLTLADRPIPQDQRNAATIENDLLALQETAGPVAFVDQHDNSYQVLVEGPNETELHKMVGEGAEGVAVIKLTEWQPETTSSDVVSATSVGARAYNSGNKSLISGTAELVALDSERFDTAEMHETTGSRTARLTCTVPGRYVITVNITFSGTWPANWSEARIRLNGSTIIASEIIDTSITPAPTSERSVSFDTLYDLALGDYVEIIVSTQAGAPAQEAAANANYSPELTMVKVE